MRCTGSEILEVAPLERLGAAATAAVEFPPATQPVADIVLGAAVPLRQVGAVKPAAIELKRRGPGVLLAGSV
jgi:hypothetical protein